MVIAAAKQQAEAPHPSTLGPPGTFAVRHRADAETGARKLEYYGRESFIKSMPNYRPARRVLRVQNPQTGHVLRGPSYERMPGF
jgi:hypothetical protein